MSDKKQKGSATIEILIALVILIMTTSAVIIILFGNQNVSVDTQTNNEALYRAQTMLETARAASRNDFSSVISQGAVSEPSGPLSYIKKLDVFDIDAFTKQATSTVSWMIGARSFKIVLSTLLTNPSSALGGDTCSQILTGDWTHPQLLGYADFPSNNGATGIDVTAHKAYVTTDPASAGAEDIYIYDVSNPNQTHIASTGKLNTGPGLAAIRVAGKYAYVADISTTAQLQVIDISNPATPLLVKSFRVTTTGDTAVGNTIFYAQKKVYLGLTKSTGREFYVIDVTDPLNPTVLGSYELNAQVNAIYVKDNVAYVATPMPTSNPPTQENLSLLNVINPASITRATTFTWANPTTMDGLSLYFGKDGRLYFGRTAGGNNTVNPEFFILNPDPVQIATPIAKKFIANGNGKGISIGSLVVRDHLVFMLTSDSNLGFQIWDVNNLGSATPYGSLNIQQSSTAGMDCDANLLYVGQSGNRALQIIGPS